MNFEPIGYIRSCYPDKFGTPRQPGLVKDSWGKVVIHPQWQPEEALQGLEGFSHLWIIFLFHKNVTARYHSKVHPPRLGGETRGVFATRSPHRPNPIGLSLVSIEKIEADGVVVRGLDLIEGTPVLDIKPYLPEIESEPQAIGGWAGELRKEQPRILWQNEQLELIASWAQRISQPKLLNMIEETLKLDPRPVVYKGFEGKNSPYRDSHAVRFFDGDIHFQFSAENEISITKVIVPS